MEGQCQGVKETSVKYLEASSELLGVSSEALLTALTKRSMYVGESIIVKCQTQSQAVEKRDSFAKSIYSMIFSWLVDMINTTISGAEFKVRGFIGVLDIYGFENFDNANGFEQLLINYANEKLQNHFNRHIFHIEQLEYESEGIDWSYITFNDNQQCVELIDGKPEGKTGIFQTLDDSNSRNCGDANAAFINQLNVNWSQHGAKSKHPNFVSPRFNSNKRFGIIHYAGEVLYDVEGFTERNRDETNNDMRELLTTSSNLLLSEMTNKTNEMNCKSSNKISKLKEDSISKQFASSLRQLYETLDCTQPHFVRCIKPNHGKLPHTFDSGKILLQLKYAGMMETIRIRQQGFALRQDHAEFFVRYLPLAPWAQTLQELICFLSSALGVSAESWQVGSTKIFFRSDMSEKLEKLLYLRYTFSARRIQCLFRHKLISNKCLVIQTAVRRYQQLCAFQKIKSCAIKLQSNYRRWRCVRFYYAAIHSSIKIQTICRGMLARRFLSCLRNPYKDMNFEQLTAKIAETYDQMTQQPVPAEKLKSTFNQMKRMLLTLTPPNRVPKNRHELYLFQLESRLRFEYDKNSEAHRCTIDHLDGYTMKFPSIDQIQRQISELQNEMETALANKDYRKCGECQSKLSALEHQKSELTPYPKLSTDQLREKVRELEEEMALVLNKKDFETCAKLQKSITHNTKELELRGDSDCAEAARKEKVADLTKIKVAKLSCLDFLGAAEYEMAIQEINAIGEKTDSSVSKTPSRRDSSVKHTPGTRTKEGKCVTSEKTAVVHAQTFESLKAAILAKKAELQETLRRNDFSKCGVLQTEIDRMTKELTKDLTPVRSNLLDKALVTPEITPSVEECYSSDQQRLYEELQAKKNDLVRAKKARNFTECENILHAIKSLEDQRDVKLFKNNLSSELVLETVQSSYKTTSPAPISSFSTAPNRSISTSAMQPPISTVQRPRDSRPVSKLRPKVPLTVSEKSSIFDATKKMSERRAAAVLLINDAGNVYLNIFDL